MIRAILLSLSLILTASPAWADDGAEVTHYEPDQTLTVNPIDAVNGFLNFEYEHALGSWVSLHAGLNFLVWEGVWQQPHGSTFAFGPEAGVRLFLIGDAPQGLWLGPYVGLGYVRVDQTPGLDGVGLYGGAMVGGTLVAFDFLALSAGVGATYHHLTPVWDDPALGLVGWTPRLRLSAGIAF
jgi:hypothetical protein